VRQNRKSAAVIAGLAAVALTIASCGSDDDDDTNGDTPSPEETEPAEEPEEPEEPMEEITLSIHVFGGNGFGFDDLVQQYMDENPGITVDHQVTTADYDGEYRPNLLQQLDAGTAPDIAAVEEGAVGQFMALDDAWVDLAQYGLDARESDYPSWVWENGHTASGTLATLGSDVGGMGMCYRTDLFEQAGLPTDREEVAALWPTWADYVDVAEQFVASGVDATFVDSPSQILNVRMIQEAGNGEGTTYFDRDGNYVLAESTAVRTAFDMVLELIEMETVAPYQAFQPEWFTAMAAGTYATQACPAWMTGVVSGNAGEDNADNWDYTTVPGGGGNWGGAWLGVTSSSEHPEEAAALVDFLTSADAQLAAFEAVGRFPASPDTQAEPAVSGLVDGYFNDAPVGQIATESIAAYEPVFFGPLHSAVKQPLENALISVIQGNVSTEDAWDEFVATGQEVVDLEGG
jgi:cellobiose transport system substrate-binding protein